MNSSSFAMEGDIGDFGDEFQSLSNFAAESKTNTMNPNYSSVQDALDNPDAILSSTKGRKKSKVVNYSSMDSAGNQKVTNLTKRLAQMSLNRRAPSMASVAPSVATSQHGKPRSSGVRLSDLNSNHDSGNVGSLHMLQQAMQNSQRVTAVELSDAVAKSSVPRGSTPRKSGGTMWSPHEDEEEYLGPETELADTYDDVSDTSSVRSTKRLRDNSGTNRPRAHRKSNKRKSKKRRQHRGRDRRSRSHFSRKRRSSNSYTDSEEEEEQDHSAESSDEEEEQNTNESRAAHLEINEELNDLNEWGIKIPPEVYAKATLKQKQRLFRRLLYKLDEREYIESNEDGIEWIADLAEKTSKAFGINALSSLHEKLETEVLKKRKLQPALRRRYRMQARSGPMFTPSWSIGRQIVKVLKNVIMENTGPDALGAVAAAASSGLYGRRSNGEMKETDLARRTRERMEQKMGTGRRQQQQRQQPQPQRQAVDPYQMLSLEDRAAIKKARREKWVAFFTHNPEAKHSGPHAKHFQYLLNTNNGVDPTLPSFSQGQSSAPPRSHSNSVPKAVEEPQLQVFKEEETPIKAPKVEKGIRRRRQMRRLGNNHGITPDTISMDALTDPLLALGQGQERQAQREQAQAQRRGRLQEMVARHNPAGEDLVASEDALISGSLGN